MPDFHLHACIPAFEMQMHAEHTRGLVLQERTDWVFIVLFVISFGCLWYVKPGSCHSVLYTWLGLLPMQVGFPAPWNWEMLLEHMHAQILEIAIMSWPIPHIYQSILNKLADCHCSRDEHICISRAPQAGWGSIWSSSKVICMPWQGCMR